VSAYFEINQNLIINKLQIKSKIKLNLTEKLNYVYVDTDSENNQK